MQNPARRRYCFGPFEVDFAADELRKHGLRRRLSGQPLQILEMLIERPGLVVSREELRNRLWAEDTFVDFERGLNAAVNRLREALGDSASKPRYIETLPRLGYRFIGELVRPESTSAKVEAAAVTAAAMPIPEPFQSNTASESTLLQAAKPKPAKSWWLWAVLALTGVVLLTAAGRFFVGRRDRFALVSKDFVLLADFENATGEQLFDDALRQGLFVGLEQSPYLQTISDRKSMAVLAQMGHSPSEKLTGPVALELCQRSGGKVVVEGSISRLGSAYIIGLTAIRCDTGEEVVHEQAKAENKEAVIDSLDQATVQLRSRLGESLRSIQQYNVPLEQATTPSLEALKAYSRGFIVWDSEGEQVSIPFFQRAVSLDPNFAMAYGALAAAYEDQGESSLATASAARAYQLRNRVGELERTLIESWHEFYVTGDLEKGLAVTELAVRTYPKAPRLLNDLGSTYGNLGHYDRAVELLQESDSLYPSETTKVNLAIGLMALGKRADAATVLDEARNLKYSSDNLAQVNYWLAFLNGDQSNLQQIVDSSSQIPGAQPLLLCEQAKTEAYYGRLVKAHQLAYESARMEHESNSELAGTCLAQQALLEVEEESVSTARATIADALRMSHERSVVTLAALVKARSGEYAEALAISAELSRAHPADTFVQKYWTPLIRAEVELNQHRPANALSILAPMESILGAAPAELQVSTLYPAYLRGQAYLAMGDGVKASQEFQKLLDHPGMVLNFPLGALARLGRARAYAQRMDQAKAKSEYAEFLKLWKTSDPTNPVGKEVRQEIKKFT